MKDKTSIITLIISVIILIVAFVLVFKYGKLYSTSNKVGVSFGLIVAWLILTGFTFNILDEMKEKN